MAWRSQPAEPYKGGSLRSRIEQPKVGSLRDKLSEQFDVVAPPSSFDDFSDPRAPKPEQYNHPDDYDRDRRRYEAARREGRTFVDTDKRRLKTQAKQRDEETTAPLREQHERRQERKQTRSDVAHLAGGALLFGAGILPVLRRETNIPVITKVAR